MVGGATSGVEVGAAAADDGPGVGVGIGAIDDAVVGIAVCAGVPTG